MPRAARLCIPSSPARSGISRRRAAGKPRSGAAAAGERSPPGKPRAAARSEPQASGVHRSARSGAQRAVGAESSSPARAVILRAPCKPTCARGSNGSRPWSPRIRSPPRSWADRSRCCSRWRSGARRRVVSRRAWSRRSPPPLAAPPAAVPSQAPVAAREPVAAPTPAPARLRDRLRRTRDALVGRLSQLLGGTPARRGAARGARAAAVRRRPRREDGGEPARPRCARRRAGSDSDGVRRVLRAAILAKLRRVEATERPRAARQAARDPGARRERLGQDHQHRQARRALSRRGRTA